MENVETKSVVIQYEENKLEDVNTSDLFMTVPKNSVFFHKYNKSEFYALIPHTNHPMRAHDEYKTIAIEILRASERNLQRVRLSVDQEVIDNIVNTTHIENKTLEDQIREDAVMYMIHSFDENRVDREEFLHTFSELVDLIYQEVYY